MRLDRQEGQAGEPQLPQPGLGSKAPGQDGPSAIKTKSPEHTSHRSTASCDSPFGSTDAQLPWIVYFKTLAIRFQKAQKDGRARGGVDQEEEAAGREWEAGCHPAPCSDPCAGAGQVSSSVL